MRWEETKAKPARHGVPRFYGPVPAVVAIEGQIALTQGLPSRSRLRIAVVSQARLTAWMRRHIGLLSVSCTEAGVRGGQPLLNKSAVTTASRSPHPYDQLHHNGRAYDLPVSCAGWDSFVVPTSTSFTRFGSRDPGTVLCRLGWPWSQMMIAGWAAGRTTSYNGEAFSNPTIVGQIMRERVEGDEKRLISWYQLVGTDLGRPICAWSCPS